MADLLQSIIDVMDKSSWYTAKQVTALVDYHSEDTVRDTLRRNSDDRPNRPAFFELDDRAKPFRYRCLIDKKPKVEKFLHMSNGKEHRETQAHEDAIRLAAREAKGYTSPDGWYESIPLATGYTLHVRCWTKAGASQVWEEFKS